MSLFRRSADSPPSPINWKTNLGALWLSQLLAMSGFYFCLPFLPLYLRENKIVPEADVAYWSGVFIAVAPVSMMIFSPIWGSLGDRYGRKMMLVRANLAGAFVLYLMATVGNIEALIVLRILQGAFTGTIQSAQTLVATGTPDNKQGFAIGLLMAAVNAGNTLGPYLGGICAKHYDAATTFKVGGYTLMASTILVVFAVRENFTPPVRMPTGNTKSARVRQRRDSITNFKMGIPILLGIAFIAFLQTYDGPFLSLYIDELYRTANAAEIAASASVADAVSGEVYSLTGTISAIASITAMGGSVLVGYIMDRKFPRWVWLVIALVCALGAFWISNDPSLFGLAFGRSTFYFFISGLASVCIVVLSRMTPSSKRGTALGWSVTARSIGWAIAPLTGAYFARRMGYGSAYGILAFCCLGMLPLFIYLGRRYRGALFPEDEDPPSMDSVGAGQIVTPGGQGRGG